MTKRKSGDFIIFFAYAAFIIVVIGISQIVYRVYARYTNKNSENVESWGHITQGPSKSQKTFEDGVDVAKLLKAKKELLNSYRWIDRKEKIVAVPIQRAMDALVEGQK